MPLNSRTADKARKGIENHHADFSLISRAQWAHCELDYVLILNVFLLDSTESALMVNMSAPDILADFFQLESILSNEDLKRVLSVPDHVNPIAYLCLGYLTEFADKKQRLLIMMAD